MAVIKCLSAKSSVRKVLNYITNKEKTEDKIISGIDCNSKTAYEEMTATKDLWGKTDGTQYFHVIQSFKPGEVTPEQAHALGAELATNQFKGYECVISTHIDKEHIHNHIVLNSVNKDTGRKYHSSKQKLLELKKENNRICERENLSIIDLNKRAPERVTSAELRKTLRGEKCWKDELRNAINTAKAHTSSIDGMKKYLKENFNIDTKIQNKNIKYLHPDQKQYIGGQKLGNDYNKEGLEYEFTRRKEQNLEAGRTDTREQYGDKQGPRRDIAADIIFRQHRANEINSSKSNSIDGQAPAMGEERHSIKPGLLETERGLPTEPSKIGGREEGRYIEAEHSDEGLDPVNEGFSGNEQSEAGKHTQDFISRNPEQRDQEQGDHESAHGIDLSSEEYSKPIMEGKGEAVRDTAANDNRLDSCNLGSNPVCGTLDEILKTLSKSIEKADQAEKATEKAEQQKQLAKQQQPKTKTKYRSHDYEQEM